MKRLCDLLYDHSVIKLFKIPWHNPLIPWFSLPCFFSIVWMTSMMPAVKAICRTEEMLTFVLVSSVRRLKRTARACWTISREEEKWVRTLMLSGIPPLWITSHLFGGWLKERCCRMAERGGNEKWEERDQLTTKAQEPHLEIFTSFLWLSIASEMGKKGGEVDRWKIQREYQSQI